MNFYFQAELHEFPQLTRGKPPVNEPEKISLGKINQDLALEFTEGHGPIRYKKEIFFFKHGLHRVLTSSAYIKCLHSLDNCRRCHAAASAHGNQARIKIPTFEFINQGT